jgi:hypothetical protein
MEIVKDEPTQVTFDPSKKYTWSNDTKFTLSGNEFGVLLNTVRALLSTREAQVVLMASQASDALDMIMADQVAKGNVVEVQE